MSKRDVKDLKMLHDNVLIEPLDDEDGKTSSIILPDSAKKKTTVGKVVAVGPGSHNSSGTLVALTVKIGDHVLYRQWAGTEIEVGKEKLMIMKESDISGVFDKK